MKELEQILRDHGRRYPGMEPTDAVKLIYQNEFGGGHMIRDEQACLNYLKREYEATPKNTGVALQENIGNGILRIYLAALKEEKLEQLGAAFIRSAAAHQGNLDAFLQKLDVLRKLTAEGIFSFDGEALEAYLAEYEKAGYPPVSHSQRYRENYHPAYRIICRAFAGEICADA